MMQHLAVVHWLPVELYPPAVNLVRYFARQGWAVSLYTTENQHGRPRFAADGVEVHRSPAPGARGAVERASSYLHYHLGTAAKIVRQRPDVVLYIEPQSAFPVYVASVLRPRTPVFVHHHEYHDPEQFLRPGMRVARAFHRLERARLFPRAAWVSHTNEERLRRFLHDQPSVRPDVARVLPNLPPTSWFSGENRAWSNKADVPRRLVYVGSLSLQDTYIREVVTWVREQPPGRVTLDIYAYNLTDETRDYLERAAGDQVRFFPEGVAYDDLPDLLRDYHTGLVLYKARTTNYAYNATNKFFEYLACGLDAVFPDRMIGLHPYARTDAWPRVFKVDFTDPGTLDCALEGRSNRLPEAPAFGTADDELARLEVAMREHARGR